MAQTTLSPSSFHLSLIFLDHGPSLPLPPAFWIPKLHLLFQQSFPTAIRLSSLHHAHYQHPTSTNSTQYHFFLPAHSPPRLHHHLRGHPKSRHHQHCLLWPDPLHRFLRSTTTPASYTGTWLIKVIGCGPGLPRAVTCNRRLPGTRHDSQSPASVRLQIGSQFWMHWHREQS